MRIRKIKQYGNTIVIKLSPSDLIDLNWKVEDSVDIDNVKKVNIKKLSDYKSGEINDIKKGLKGQC